MIVRNMKNSTGQLVYRDDQPDWMGEYMDPEFQVAVSIKYDVKFMRYGIHPQSKKAIYKRLIEAAKADPRSWPQRVMYGGPGSTEVVAIFNKVDLL